MNEVKKYLEKGRVDFAEGFALLKKYCDNDGIISLVEKRKNLPYLIFELKRLARIPHLKPNRHFVDLGRPLSDSSSLDEPKGKDEVIVEGDQVDDHIVDWHKLEHYKNTKYDDMPNDFCKKSTRKTRIYTKSFSTITSR